MVFDYNKLEEELKKSKGEINTDRIKKFSRSGVPVHSIIELIKAKTKNDNTSNKHVGEEGWISYEKDFPHELIEEIKKAVLKGYIGGEEKEEFYSKARKYEIEHDRVDDVIKLESEIVAAKVNDIKKRHQHSVVIIGSIIILFITFLLLYFLIIVPRSNIKYVVPNNLNLRKSKLIAEETVIRLIQYGSKVKIYKIDSLWAKVKVGNDKGFIPFPYKYLADKLTFYEIDGLFGNKEAREAKIPSYLKKELIVFFKQNNYQGVLSKDIQKKIYSGKNINNEVWQIFGFDKEARFNSFCEGKLMGTEKNCCAVVITKLSSGEKRLLIFKFDSRDKGTLITNEFILSYYDGISIISRERSIEIFKQEKLATQPRSPCIIAGGNDIYSKIPQAIYIFNGKGFDSYSIFGKWK
jgi:hypothetical protein